MGLSLQEGNELEQQSPIWVDLTVDRVPGLVKTVVDPGEAFGHVEHGRRSYSEIGQFERDLARSSEDVHVEDGQSEATRWENRLPPDVHLTDLVEQKKQHVCNMRLD